MQARLLVGVCQCRQPPQRNLVLLAFTSASNTKPPAATNALQHDQQIMILITRSRYRRNSVDIDHCLVHKKATSNHQSLPSKPLLQGGLPISPASPVHQAKPSTAGPYWMRGSLTHQFAPSLPQVCPSWSIPRARGNQRVSTRTQAASWPQQHMISSSITHNQTCSCVVQLIKPNQDGR